MAFTGRLRSDGPPGTGRRGRRRRGRRARGRPAAGSASTGQVAGRPRSENTHDRAPPHRDERRAGARADEARDGQHDRDQRERRTEPGCGDPRRTGHQQAEQRRRTAARSPARRACGPGSAGSGRTARSRPATRAGRPGSRRPRPPRWTGTSGATSRNGARSWPEERLAARVAKHRAKKAPTNQDERSEAVAASSTDVGSDSPQRRATRISHGCTGLSTASRTPAQATSSGRTSTRVAIVAGTRRSGRGAARRTRPRSRRRRRRRTP